MILPIIFRNSKMLKILMLLFFIISFITPALAAIEDDYTGFLNGIDIWMVLKTLAVLFFAYAGIKAINGDGGLIKLAFIGLILAFGTDIMVSPSIGIFSH